MDAKSILILIALAVLCTPANIGVIGVQAKTFEYHLGNYSLSFELSDSRGYNVTIWPCPVGVKSDLVVNRLNLIKSVDKNITFWVNEHSDSYPLNLTELKKFTESDLDSQGIKYSSSDTTIDGHHGYIRHVPRQRIGSNMEERPEYYDAVYRQDAKTSVQVEVVGLGEEVFKQLIGSIRVEGSYADGHFQLKSFKFDPWGFYYSAESQGKVYFAAYDHYEMGMHPMSYYDVLYEKSEDRNLSKYGLLTDILIDDNTESSINPEIPLKLKEGYELTIKPIDYRVSFELKKNGQTVDSKLESSLLDTSTAKATLMDKTYAYSKDLGEAKKIVTIAVHLKDRNTVDGIFQLSENPISVLSISRELI